MYGGSEGKDLCVGCAVLERCLCTGSAVCAVRQFTVATHTPFLPTDPLPRCRSTLSFVSASRRFGNISSSAWLIWTRRLGRSFSMTWFPRSRTCTVSCSALMSVRRGPCSWVLCFPRLPGFVSHPRSTRHCCAITSGMCFPGLMRAGQAHSQ